MGMWDMYLNYGTCTRTMGHVGHVPELWDMWDMYLNYGYVPELWDMFLNYETCT